MKNPRPVIALLILVTLCLSAYLAYAAHSKSSCRVCKVPVKVGMPRSDVETMVATALGKESQYSPYANNLAGGTVAYVDGGWVLLVTYLQGTPAPRVINAEGIGEHFPPHEEAVAKFELGRLAR